MAAGTAAAAAAGDIWAVADTNHHPAETWGCAGVIRGRWPGVSFYRDDDLFLFGFRFDERG